MKKMKRLLSLLLVIVLLISNLPLSVLAAGEDGHVHEDGEVCTLDHNHDGESEAPEESSEEPADEGQDNASDVPAAEDETVVGDEAPAQEPSEEEKNEGDEPSNRLPDDTGLSEALGGIDFVYDASRGSVAVGGEAEVSTLSQETSGMVTATATPAPGYDFVAWINAESNLILSTETTASINALENPEVGVVFTASDGSDNATFTVGTKTRKTFTTNIFSSNEYYTVSAGGTLYSDLNAAIAAAGSNGVIVLASSGVLPAGDYTIPSGVALLIPFDSTYTMYTAAPQSMESRVNPTAFRTLTLASGAKLNVNGELSVSGQHLRTTSGSAGTAPNGPLGWIKMESGSSINVNSGAKLYAWGYITGAGSVVANSGASVYENFQVMDFRGGSATTTMAEAEKAFPFSQYYVQNIEVPMYIYAGAKEYSFVTLYMSYQHITASVNFIGSSGSMFNLTSGYVIKWYDGTTDRLMVDSYGTMSVSPISISMGTSIAGFDIDTSKFELPINSNITVHVYSGQISIEQDIALLPGAKIIVDSGAKCLTNASAYFIDADDWGGYTYLGKKLAPVAYAPSRTYTRSEKDLVDAEIIVNGIIDASNGYAYTTNGGASITGSDAAVGTAILRTGSTTSIYFATQVDTDITDVLIPVISAKLKNADGTYVKPSATTYYFSDGKWDLHVWGEGKQTVAPSCTTDGVMTYTCVQPNCANCGTTHATKTETIPALGHTDGEMQVENEIAATCTTGGSYDEVVRCARCGAEQSRVSKTVSALGHDIVIDAAKAPTCTETGLTEGSHCSRCSDATVKQTVVAATGHTAKAAVKENVVAATCTTAGSYDSVVYCASCGIEMSRTKGTENALGHNTDGVKKENEVAATCTAGGSYTKITYCTRCSTEQSRNYVTVDALGHDTAGTGVVTAPTCTAQGYTTYTCKRCGDVSKSDFVSATGHTEVTDAAVAPTCTETGLTEGKHCSVCNTVIVAQQVQAKLGHKFVEYVSDNNATCTEDGTETAKCDRCDATNTRTVADSALGHTPGEPVKENEVEDTCNADGGYDSVVYCTVCGAKISSSHVVVNDITQHVFEKLQKNEVAATCTTAGGYEIYYDCKYCDAGFSGGTVTIPATGHTSGTPVVENTVAATCTVDGSYDEVVYCTVCGGEVSRTEKTVAKLGHTSGEAKEENRVEASCTVDGSYDTVVRCTVCNEVISSVTTVLTAPGHTPKAAVKEKEVAATCTTAGSYDEVVYCDVCGDEISRIAKTVAELGHTPGAAADCENPQTCTVCGAKLEDALGHTAAEAVKENEKAATCTADGSYDEVVYCDVCGDELSRENKTVVTEGHGWSAWSETKKPTCTEEGEKSRSCSVCGETETQVVAALGHDVVQVESKAPTCTEEGLSVSGACSRCDYTEGETVIPALGHDYKPQVTTAATCTTEGVMTYTCQRENCGHSYTKPIPVAPHNLNEASAKAATCDEDGWKLAFFCSVCGTYFADDKADEIIGDAADYAAWKTGAGKEERTGHTSDTPVVENSVAATCTAEGSYDEVVYCSVCGDEISRTAKTEAKLDHTPGEAKEEDRVEATCTSNGSYNTVVRCAVCNAILSSTPNTISSTGHSPAEAVKENVQSASCTEPGSYDEVVYCSVCGEQLSRDEKTETAPGHSWSEWSESKAPTCTDAGEETRSCSVCNETEKRDVDAAGHSWSEWSESKAPTCTELGEETRSCSVCNETEKRSVDATGHDLANLVVTHENEVAATCDTAGSYDVVYTCPKCSEVLFTEPVSVPATGHTPGTAVVENTVAATCTVDGSYDKVVYCEVCDKEVSRDPVAIPATGHSWGEEVTEKVVAATCETDGSYDTVIYCSVCDAEKEGSRTTTTVPSTGHSWSEWSESKAPTCTELGEETRSCANCSETEKRDVAALGHTPAEAVKENEVAATCTAAGSYDEVIYCSVCDAEISRSAKTVAMKAHTPGEAKEEERVEATCTTDGSYKTVVRCTECDTVLSSSSHTIPASGHTPAEAVKENEAAATCTEDGKYDEVVYCSNCDAEMSRNTVTIPALGHTEGPDATCEAPQLCTVCGAQLAAALGHKAEPPVVENTVAATCTEDGSYDKVVYCEVCDKEISREKVTVSATGHSLVLDSAVPATCTEDGLTAGQHCEICGHVEVAQTVITAPGHNWDAGVVQIEATCTEDGEMLYTCAICEETKTEVIAALGHDLVQHEAKNPTYSSVGWEAYETCSRCDYSTYVEIPMLERGEISDYETFMENLAILEAYANEYAQLNPGKDPMALLIKYIRTGVDRYNSGSWGIMAGYEDAGFAQFVQDKEDAYNDSVDSQEEMIIVTSLKNIKNFILPSGEYTDFGHMFGTMDISYHNIKSQNHADVSGWAGDLVDLLELSDYYGVDGTLDEMIAEITDTYFLIHYDDPASFSDTDFIGDLDGYYVIEQLKSHEYSAGLLCEIFEGYFTEQLSRAVRAEYFLNNRLGGVSSRDAIRDAVFNGYTANQVVATLEATREFQSDNLADLRRATCYAFADYLCKLAGDYVVIGENIYFDKFYSENSTLAPGITQQINMATTADGKQIKYYIATGDITSQYVNVYANYNNAYPETGWGMARVRDQANAAQARYGDPSSPDYIENYNVIAAINGAGYNMTTGEPGGLLVMNGVEYHGPNANGFFGILDDGTAYIGTTEEYNTIYKDRLMEGIAGFGSVLIKDGKIVVGYEANYTSNRASRTAVGITRTGKVVFMVLDGRQEPVSCGGSMQEIAQIMLEAGCVVAINLDGGGSTTYIAKQPGQDELTLVSSPSDGFERSVGTSLMMVSTAPSSTAFDHAVLEADNSYLTVGAQAQLTATGVSPMGNAADIPEGTTWAVSDSSLGSIDENGVFTALSYGDVHVYLMLDGVPVGSTTLHVVRPDAVYFTRSHIDAVYGEAVELPVAALYQGKPVTILEGDVVLSLANTAAGVLDGFTFTGDEASGIKNVTVTAALAHDPTITASIVVNLYNQGEASFDFNQATGGDRMLAWDRQVSNSTTEDGITYMVETVGEDMVTSYIFAIDMTQIPIPERLSDLVYMLPGADVEGANSAWNFLLQLAERISPISEVKPALRFDKNMEIDYSGLTIVCEYFELTKTEYDEENNTLTLTLNWKDQTQAIDPETANPICIVSGVKLTPKDDAAWDSKDRLNVLNSGEISYTIAMRASALYTFAQKPENQETYGIYPYVNPNDESDRGGMFSDVYKEFEDSYTLVNSAKSGWVYEEGGYAYYVDGEKLTGIQLIEGYYYDFGEDGINIGQTKYTGLFQIDGVNHYARDGVLVKGWVTIREDQYCFDENGAGYDGTHVVDEVELIFENGKLVGGYTGFITKSDGKTYHYINGKQTFSWYFNEENGYWYHFDAVDGSMTTGTKVLPDAESRSKNAYYDFADDGRLLRAYFNPAGYYYWAGLPLKDSWVKNGYDPDPEAWYRTNGHGHYVTDPTGNYTFELVVDEVTYTAVRIPIDGAVYTFNNANGKLLLGAVVSENGKIYYYWAGEVMNDGWFTINGETRYAYPDGHLAKGTVTIDNKTYFFDSQGVLQPVTGNLTAEIGEDGVMTITYSDEGLSNARFAVWSTEAGQGESLVWINAAKDENGNWVASLSMCTFGIEGEFIVHAYTSESGSQRFLGELRIELNDIGHVYDDMYDLICNACGHERPIPSVPMFRMYDPNSGEHFYTGSERERDFLVSNGWNYEGVAFNFPVIGEPVYRLYNTVTGDHLYTMDLDERATLLAQGWNDEGVAFNSATPDCVPQYRLWNPNAVRGAWHFTGSERERDFLLSLGWQYQGIGWYSMLE